MTGSHLLSAISYLLSAIDTPGGECYKSRMGIAHPRLHIPRHPLWLAAYEGAWTMLVKNLPDEYPLAYGDDYVLTMLTRYSVDLSARAEFLSGLHRIHLASSQLEHSLLAAWTEWQQYQTSGDIVHLHEALPYLILLYEAMQQSRRRASGLYWRAMHEDDNAPREAHERVAVTARQSFAAECIVNIAHVLQQNEVERRFRAEWKTLCDLINRLCWDEQEQFYFDRRADGSRSTVKCSAGLWPLMAGVSTPAQADALVRCLTNPQEFWRVHVFPSLPADHPRYADRGVLWRGSVWPLNNYAIIKGLERYGYHALAVRAADNHLTTISHVFKETQSLWDNYAPEYIEPGSIARPDSIMVGLRPVALLIETICGLWVDAPARTLHWRPCLREVHAVEDLRAGESAVSLRVTPRSDELRAHIAVSAPLRLHLSTAASERWFEVKTEVECGYR